MAASRTMMMRRRRKEGDGLTLARAAAALGALGAGRAAAAQEATGGGAPCEVICKTPPEAGAAVSAADNALDLWTRAWDACGCALPPAPDSEAAVLPPLGEELEPAGLYPGFALRAAVVDELCATELQPFFEWTEDARQAEISATTITLFGMTDHVHYTPMCNALCDASCGGVPTFGASSVLAAAVGLGNCITVTPLEFWEWFRRQLEDGTEIPVNVSGFDADDADVSTIVFLSFPVFNETDSSLRFNYRVPEGLPTDPGRRKLLQVVVSRDTLVVSRVHLTGTMNSPPGGAGHTDTSTKMDDIPTPAPLPPL